MKQLTTKEVDMLADLLRRAQETNQIMLNVASPYAEGTDWKADGWTFNDRHDGNGANLSGCHVEVSTGSGEEPIFRNGEGEPDWVEYKDRPEVAVFVDDDTLCRLTGILPEEADAVIAARKARAARAGRAKSAKKAKASRKNWKKAVRAIKTPDV